MTISPSLNSQFNVLVNLAVVTNIIPYILSMAALVIIHKPALSYLDVIRECSDAFDLPMCAYSVSGEYAMIKAAGAAGLVDEYRIMCESALSVFRAGANMLITYYAKELAQAIQKGDIG